jgi:hypothetical protein
LLPVNVLKIPRTHSGAPAIRTGLVPGTLVTMTSGPTTHGLVLSLNRLSDTITVSKLRWFRSSDHVRRVVSHVEVKKIGKLTRGTMEQKSCFYIKLQTCSIYFAETIFYVKYNVLLTFCTLMS